LEEYFEPWRGRLNAGAVGAFLSLLGKGRDGAIHRLAQEWLGEDVSVEGVIRALTDQESVTRGIRTLFTDSVAQRDRAQALNLLGGWAEMRLEEAPDTIFATDPEHIRNWRGDFWNNELGDIERGSASRAKDKADLPFRRVVLRDVGPGTRTAPELLELLRGTVERWAVRFLKIQREAVDTWWKRWGTGSQTQVGPVRASILAHLPLTLRQLDVREHRPLHNALKRAQRAQRLREQNPSDSSKADDETAALQSLAEMIRDDCKTQSFLWERLQESMRQCSLP
jgi:hypothetical protein